MTARPPFVLEVVLALGIAATMALWGGTTQQPTSSVTWDAKQYYLIASQLAAGHTPAAELRVGERQADGDRESAADDGVPAVETCGRIEHVHRAAASAAAPLLLAEHLSHERVRRDPAGEGVPVLPVGGDDRVVRREGLHDADGDRFLADIEMQETTNLAGAVHLGALLLEAPDAQHFVQQTPCTIGSLSPMASAVASITRACSSSVHEETSVEWALTVMAETPSTAAVSRRCRANDVRSRLKSS